MLLLETIKLFNKFIFTIFKLGLNIGCYLLLLPHLLLLPNVNLRLGDFGCNLRLLPRLLIFFLVILKLGIIGCHLSLLLFLLLLLHFIITVLSVHESYSLCKRLVYSHLPIFYLVRIIWSIYGFNICVLWFFHILFHYRVLKWLSFWLIRLWKLKLDLLNQPYRKLHLFPVIVREF